MNNRHLLTLLIAAIAALGAAGCQAIESGPAGLLAQYGWQPIGPARVTELTVGDHADLPWSLYQEASQKIGLSLPRAGTAARLVTIELRHERPLTGRVLLVGDMIAGAWLANNSVPGIFALDEAPD